MQTRTIDSIVRGCLHDLGLSLHFYLKLLGYALRELEELALTYPIVTNIKTVELDVTDYQRATLPEDYIEYTDVYLKNAERTASLARDKKLNLEYNLDSEGNKIKYPSSAFVTVVVNDQGDDSLAELATSGSHAGGYYGLSSGGGLTFNVDTVNNELVFSNLMTESKVWLMYQTSGVSTTSANTVHPYCVDVIEKAIHLKREKYGKKIEKSNSRTADRDYKVSKRKFRARLLGMSAADFLRIMRQGVHQSIKN